MFDIGFSEIVVIFVLALIVLGPERLPRVVREVGRWVGRARAMARQFQEQLEEEVDVDRGRTIRPQPVRPVGGVPPVGAAPLTAEHAEPVSDTVPPWQTGPDPRSEAAGPSGDPPPPAPLNPGTHERGT